jgi:Na+/H+ antiporter NhaD/arsenite permease-like protein
LTSSSFQLQEEKKEKKNHKEEKKCRKGKELSFNLLLCFLIFGSCFYLHTFGLLFQTLFLGIFFFLRKKKKKKKKKHRKKNVEKEKNLLSSSRFALSILTPASSTLPLLPFCFKCFLMASSSFQTKKNKNHKEEKKMQRKEGAFLQALVLHFWLPFLPFCFKRFLLGIFFFSSRRKEKKKKE